MLHVVSVHQGALLEEHMRTSSSGAILEVTSSSGDTFRESHISSLRGSPVHRDTPLIGAAHSVHRRGHFWRSPVHRGTLLEGYMSSLFVE